ncbi:MAG: PilZ domain-containing protein [Deltaproteobacteria bacterium]|nr:PilZ domain-containing protein [Deltaproteobacteria bacterium]
MIGPGKSVKIVYDLDIVKEEIILRNSFVYDVKGDKIIVSQTDPAFTEDDIGRFVIVTYVEREKKKFLRFGLDAEVVEIRKDVKFENGITKEAVVIRQLNKPSPYNLRRYARIQVPSSINIKFYVNDENVPLLDLSIGGACFSYHKVPLFSEGDKLKSTIITETRSFDLETKIVRLDRLSFPGKDIYRVSSEFFNTPAHVKRALTTILFEIEKVLRWTQGERD